MKNGGKSKSVAFIILVSVNSSVMKLKMEQADMVVTITDDVQRVQRLGTR